MTTYPMSPAALLTAETQDILEAILLPDEQVIRVGLVSPWAYWKSGAVAAAALMTLVISVNLALYFLAIALVLFLLAFSARKYLLLVATDRRLVVRGGIINVEVLQFGYDKIESIELSSMLLGQIFGYASVIISGTGRRRVTIPYIANAMAFTDDVTERIMAESGRIKRDAAP